MNGAGEIDEREALERELAALLATVSVSVSDVELPDDDVDPHDSTERESYQRVNLSDVLRQLNEETIATNATTDESWSSLLATVARCDREVFAAFEHELQELKVEMLLTPPVQATGSSPQEQQQQERIGHSLPLSDEQQTPPPAMGTMEPHQDQEAVVSDLVIAPSSLSPSLPVQPASASACVTEGSSLVLSSPFSPSRDEAQGAPSRQNSENESVSDAVSMVTMETETRELLSLLSSTTTTVDFSEDAAATVCQQHATQQLQQQEEATQAMAAWLREMEAQWAREAEAQEAQRVAALQEERGRAAMAREELQMRRWLETSRQQREVSAMAAEDALATQCEADAAAEREREALDRAAMAAEEAFEWRRLRLERERHRKERREEERLRLRRDWGRVLDELTARHRERLETQRREQAAERRRAARETAAMQAEELRVRKLVVQRETERRRRELAGMTREDEMGIALRREQRRAAQERERMQTEEIETQRWLLRQRALERWLTRQCSAWSRRRLAWRWRRWRTAIVDIIERERERDRRRLELRQRMAARMIAAFVGHRWLESRRQQQQAAAAAAAKMVQSAFRGFHVRRRFQNALEMASRLAGDDALDEIDLDELIERPPELEDDWERPSVLPKVAAWAPQQLIEDVPEDREEEDEEPQDVDEEEEDEEDERVEQATAESLTPQPQRQELSPVNDVGGGNLAVTLWNRMRHKAKKRQQQLDERQRQQDPAYRLQKVLHKSKAPSSHTVSASTSASGAAASVSTSVTWSSNPEKKKRAKVKLPSLVERLRKKTAAAR
ncbi:hypothetical protein PINS_up010979 [Pythium insidiosum]|nr:hypothetical protein PINS_up010979 [Pythium insidiosum]